VAAYLISLNGNSSPAELSATIQSLSVKGALTGILYNRFVLSIIADNGSQGIPTGTINDLANIN
jgi:hypothetical protein